MSAVRERIGSRLSRTIFRLLLVALCSFVVVVALDFVMVRGPRPARAALENSSLWLGVWLLSSGAAGVGFFLALLSHTGDRPEPSVLKPAALSFVLACLWLLFAFTALVNIHFLFGGRI